MSSITDSVRMVGSVLALSRLPRAQGSTTRTSAGEGESGLSGSGQRRAQDVRLISLDNDVSTARSRRASARQPLRQNFGGTQTAVDRPSAPINLFA